MKSNIYYKFNECSFMMEYCNFKSMFKDNLELIENIGNWLMCMVLLGYIQRCYFALQLKSNI